MGRDLLLAGFDANQSLAFCLHEVGLFQSGIVKMPADQE
jgi:hypothetical protein